MTGDSFFLSLFPISGAMAFLAAIAFLIGAAQDAKTSGSKSDVVKHIYFYLTAFITLTIIVFAGAALLNVGLRSWALTKADDVNSFRGTPPPIYLSAPASNPKADVLAGIVSTCTADTCTFTNQDKADVTTWQSNYQSWKQGTDASQTRATTTVTALSFLIVAALAFWFHWRIIQKEQKSRADGQPLVTRAIYFWSMSLFGLLMIVIAGGFLLNVLLRSWLYPSLDTGTNAMKPTAVASEQANIDSLISCGSACGFTEEQVQLARDWKVDYAAATSTTEVSKSAKRQSDVATSLPFVLVGIPLFFYHWRTVRRKQTGVPPAIGGTA